MLISSYKRVVLIPFAIALITITICYVYDYSGAERPPFAGARVPRVPYLQED
jgi:hypothetical protein